jgi:hypothetical protein
MRGSHASDMSGGERRARPASSFNWRLLERYRRSAPRGIVATPAAELMAGTRGNERLARSEPEKGDAHAVTADYIRVLCFRNPL